MNHGWPSTSGEGRGDPEHRGIDAHVFAAFARDRADVWNCVIGCRVGHRTLGVGRISEVDYREKHAAYLLVRFDDEPERAEPRRFPVSLFGNPYFSEIVPPNGIEGLAEFVVESEQRRIKDERQKEEKRQEEAEENRRRKEEAASVREFAALRSKYRAEAHPDRSLNSRLYRVLLQIDSLEGIDDDDVRWLEEAGLFAALALYHESAFDETGDPWHTVHASKYWRDAHQSTRALDRTEWVTDAVVQYVDARLLAAALTSRGGAYRDLGRLRDAEHCAFQALDHAPNGWQPYNLLGAIYYQKGMPEKGDEFFEEAERRGARVSLRDSVISTAIARADDEERRRVAQYLLQRDPHRYRWAARYLS